MQNFLFSCDNKPSKNTDMNLCRLIKKIILQNNKKKEKNLRKLLYDSLNHKECLRYIFGASTGRVYAKGFTILIFKKNFFARAIFLKWKFIM